MEAKIGNKWIKILSISGKAATYNNEILVCSCNERSNFNVEETKIVCETCGKTFQVKDNDLNRFKPEIKTIKRVKAKPRHNPFADIAQMMKDEGITIDPSEIPGTIQHKIAQIKTGKI